MGVSVPPISVSTTKISELSTTPGFNCVKINVKLLFSIRHPTLTCVGWITHEIIEFIFTFKNIVIQYVKQSENKAANCLFCLLFLNLIA